MKRLLKITGYVIGFIISSIIILALLIDANSFKPRIAALALERGVILDMRGDLHWAFWPSLGLAVEDLSIASRETPAKPIAEIKQASLLMALIPLLRSDFQVKHIVVDGAVINLSVDGQGKGNWEAISKSQAAPTATQARNNPASAQSSDLHLSIEEISLHNSAISYIDQGKGQRLQLSDIQLDIKDANTDGEPFAMDFSGLAISGDTAKSSSPSLAIKTKLHQRITLNKDFSAIELNDGDLKLELNAKSAATIAAKYSLKITRLGNDLQYRGSISVPDINAKTWLAALVSAPKTANDKALTDISFAADISGDQKQLAFNNVDLQLDQTQLKGDIAIANFATQAINIVLQGDHINLDDYLAPAPEASPTGAASSTASPDTPLPLELLRSLNLNSKLNMNTLVFSQLNLEKTQLDISAHNGAIKQELSSDAYSGSIHQKLTMTVAKAAADLQFETVVKSVQVSSLLKDKKLDKNLQLSGAIDANASGRAAGASSRALFHSLTANANFAGAEMRLAPINIEQKFCQMVDLLNKAPEQQKPWHNYTELQEVSGKISIANGIITIDSLTAGIKKLQLATTGTINLDSGSYDFMLPLKLVRDAEDTAASITTSAQGCTVTSNYWAERSMALLRCKGSYADINPGKDCRPDKDLLNGILKDYAAYRLKEKHGEKIEAKKAELIQKIDEKLGGEGKAEQTRALLKNLFKKKDEQQSSRHEQ